MYAYSIGKRNPPEDWLKRAATAMGLDGVGL